MKVYTKIILDNNNNILEQEYYSYKGPVSLCGIHYDFKSTRSSKLMEKQAKRKLKLAERKAKRLAKGSSKKNQEEKPALDPNKPISLDFLTNPDKE
tara:strand:+ start:554 stop:841 length:288 start_codon:yes stop_codon:yes gene_type:complete